jgi:surface carbohydrate biosynthesis protein
MNKVAIPIENKVRELDGKIWLGLNFIDRDWEVVIGPSWEVDYILDSIEPDVYFAKDIGDGSKNFFSDLDESGIIICGMNPESNANNDGNAASGEENSLNWQDMVFAWGENNKQDYRKYYSASVVENKVKPTGNPRFDLYTEGLRDFYIDDKLDLKTDFGNYILINTNFNQANPFDRQTRLRIREKNNQIGNDYEDTVTKQFSTFYGFIQMIFYILSRIDKNVVVRPHPGEDHSTYDEIFENHQGVLVEHYDDVCYWIAQADGVIHHDCTTGIQSALMGTPVLSYQPHGGNQGFKPLSQVVSKQVTSTKEVVNWVKNRTGSSEEYTLTVEQKNRLTDYFPNIERLAAPLICEFVEDIETKSEKKKFQYYTKEKIEYNIKKKKIWPIIKKFYKKFGAYLFGEVKINRYNKKHHKFPGLRKNEVESKCDHLLGNISLDSVSVERVKNTNHTYNLTPKYK